MASTFLVKSKMRHKRRQSQQRHQRGCTGIALCNCSAILCKWQNISATACKRLFSCATLPGQNGFLGLTPATISDPDPLRASLQGRALDTPLGWYRPQESWTKLTVKALRDLFTPGERSPRDHRRPRPLEGPPTHPRPPHLDPPHRVGPGRDTRCRHQRHMPRDNTPTKSPSGEGSSGRPEPSGTVGQATAPTRDTALRAAGLHYPADNPPPPPPPTDSDHSTPEVWCTVLERGRYYVVAAAAASPGPQWVIRGTDTMPAPGAAPPGATGDPTTTHKVLRGVLQPRDQAPARALAQITSRRAGYHLGLAMLCLSHLIKRRWPSTRTVPWIWAIPTAHTQVQAGLDTKTTPPKPQHSLLRVPRHQQGPLAHGP